MSQTFPQQQYAASHTGPWPKTQKHPSAPPPTTPSNTLYVRNINEKVKIPILKESLHNLFSNYGMIGEIVAHKNLKMRGQAFVVFDSTESATRAISQAQGYQIWGKPIALQYSRKPSDATIKRMGGEEALERHKRERLAEKERKKAAEPLKPSGVRKPKKPSTKGSMVPDEYLPPNKIMFLQNLPDTIDAEALTSIFRRFTGFREIRMVPGRKGIAFVEYERDQDAVSAKQGTSGMILDGKEVKVSYARK